jgi:hypothetical protein
MTPAMLVTKVMRASAVHPFLIEFTQFFSGHLGDNLLSPPIYLVSHQFQFMNPVFISEIIGLDSTACDRAITVYNSDLYTSGLPGNKVGTMGYRWFE